MSDQQRQYYLRQQLKAIKEELGEREGGSDTSELRERIEKAALPRGGPRRGASAKLERLEQMPQASPEYQMVRTYIDWVLEVPWSTSTEDRLDLIEARRVLDEDHYDLDKVKERIVEYLAVRKLKGDMKGPILCFVGPPGVGKTSLGQSIARAMNRKFVRISLGGVRDEAEIRGHRRTYIGAIPGRIVQAMKQAGSMNPVFMLDEIDKVSAGGFTGDPSAALLEVLDPAQNNTFRDHYLEVALDLSRVLFIATANQLGTVHPALLDRMEVIFLSGYTEEDKLHIARRYLLPRQLAEHGVTAGQMDIDEGGIRRIVAEYTREAGVRNAGAPARRGHPQGGGAHRDRDDPGRAPAGAGSDGPRRAGASRRAARRGPARHLVGRDDIPAFLGPPRFKRDSAFRTSRPGVATGVAWTESGGDVLYVEASILPGGRGQFILTGQLGQRDAGVGARRRQPHPRAGRRAEGAGRVPRPPRPPRARAGRRHPQGRPVGRRDHRHRHPLGAAQAGGARGRGDDGRDHALGPRPARRRHPREGAGCPSPWPPHVRPARAEQADLDGVAGGTGARDDVRPGRNPRRGARRPRCQRHLMCRPSRRPNRRPWPGRETPRGARRPAVRDAAN